MSAVDVQETAVSAEDLVAISTDVWLCFLGEEPFPGAPADAAGTDTLLASVGITGAWNGHVVLELGEREAEEAARRMLGVTEVSTAEVADATGELVNMIGGNVKSLLPTPNALGLPLVVAGGRGALAGGGLREAARADLVWAGAPVRVTVWHSPAGTTT